MRMRAHMRVRSPSVFWVWMTTRRDDAHVRAGQGTEATLRVGEEHFCTKGLMILERNYLDVYPCALCPPSVRPRRAPTRGWASFSLSSLPFSNSGSWSHSAHTHGMQHAERRHITH